MEDLFTGEAELGTHRQEISLQGVDLGVEEEFPLDSNSLAGALGFNKLLPFQFNGTRHPTGLNAWSSPEEFKNVNHLIPLSLHWHQLAGIHSIIRNTFTTQPDSTHCTGMLIADEVGLGKTAMVVATIATLNHFFWIQNHTDNAPLPPILSRPVELLTTS